MLEREPSQDPAVWGTAIRPVGVDVAEVARVVSALAATARDNPCREIDASPSPTRTAAELRSWHGEVDLDELEASTTEALTLVKDGQTVLRVFSDELDLSPALGDVLDLARFLDQELGLSSTQREEQL